MKLRTYRDGDEAELAALFNLCFRDGIMRTAESWRWRFMNRPNFDPEGVIIAEDSGELQGCVIAVPRKPYLFEGQEMRVVHADDLCVRPNARGVGLGTTLVKALMTYAQEREAMLLGYVAKGGAAHRIEGKLGWKGVDEYLFMRRSADSNATPAAQTQKNSKQTTVTRLSERNVDAVIDFLNSWNSKKFPYPTIDRPEYEWRYLTYRNCNSNSIFLIEEGARIVGHVAVSSHPSTSSQKPFVTLSEPCGEIQEVLQSIDYEKYSNAGVAISPGNRTQYESAGFFPAATGVVHVMDYTGSNVTTEKGAEWYLFPESIFGAP